MAILETTLCIIIFGFFLITVIGNIILAKAVFETSSYDQNCNILFGTPEDITNLQNQITSIENTPLPTNINSVNIITLLKNQLKQTQDNNNNQINDVNTANNQCSQFMFDNKITSISKPNALIIMKIALILSLIISFLVLLGSLYGIKWFYDTSY